VTGLQRARPASHYIKAS